MSHLLSRRQWLASAARGTGAALVLSQAGARLALAAPAGAAVPESQRLVVVLLRGALDGLAAVPAVGDPAWQALRGAAEGEAARAAAAPLPLDGTFAMHPGLATLHRWYGEGSLLVVHAAASAYRERSHFDAQQLLESGGSRPFELSSGWLGRALAVRDGRGVALGPALPLGLRGAPGATSWAPTRSEGADADLLARVQALYRHDEQLGPLFTRAAEQHLQPLGEPASGAGFVALAQQAGRFLAADDGPTVAWLDSTGWDTHTQQAARLGRLLPVLDQGLAALRTGLGPRWVGTTVLVMTEFGRSAVLNGSGGTDHGTAGVAFLAGGAVAGGKVRGDWPGLARAQLHEARDLRATTDLRALVKPVLQRHLGLSTAQLDGGVLPGAPAGLRDLWRT
jgi:uncharacterized protein (DUF1501 family)